MMIDVVVADCVVDDVVRTVIEAARTGQRGDGRVFVIPVEEAYTIRTRGGGPD
jgi:nitrogen regulatory protein PII